MRRLLFGYAFCSFLLLGIMWAGFANGEDAEPSEERSGGFSLDTVAELAVKLAREPYRAPEALAASQSEMLDRKEWNELNGQMDSVLWDDDDHPFFVRVLPAGFVFSRALAVRLVGRDGEVKDFAILPGAGNGDAATSARSGEKPPDIGGFSFGLRGGLMGDEEAVPHGKYLGSVGTAHLGFRGRNARSKCFNRTTIVNAVSGKEEIGTYFREMWLVEPRPGDASFVFYALLDSPALTGAVRFEIEPGVTTVTRVKERLFKRAGVPLPERIGMAPLASMFLFSETQPRPADDYRPEVHNSDGLLYAGEDGWFWRPLSNPERLQVTTYPFGQVNGFGLMQRDRNFDHYQDLDNRFDQSSSVWVEFDDASGAGSVELVEIPGTRDSHTNMLAYWVPDAKLLHPKLEAGDLSLSYTMYWMPTGVSPHSLGRVSDTRLIRSAAGDCITFIIDFEGGELKHFDAETGLTSEVEAPEQVSLLEKKLVKNPVNGGWRLLLKYSLPQGGVLQNLLKVRDGAPRLQFTARLKKGENIPQPLTETWVYNFLP